MDRHRTILVEIYSTVQISSGLSRFELNKCPKKIGIIIYVQVIGKVIQMSAKQLATVFKKIVKTLH